MICLFPSKNGLLLRQARERQLIYDYQALKKAPKSLDIDEWLLQWEGTYTQCQKYKLPDVQGSRAVYDFVDAAGQVHPGFTDYWANHLRRLPEEEIPSLYEIVQLFREYNMTNSSRSKRTEVAFSTLKGKRTRVLINMEIRHRIETNQEKRKGIVFAKNLIFWNVVTLLLTRFSPPDPGF